VLTLVISQPSATISYHQLNCAAIAERKNPETATIVRQALAQTWIAERTHL